MANTTWWIGGGQNVAQVDSLTIGGAPVAGNTVSAVINAKSITYTCVTGDTTATTAAGLLALLNANGVPGEFGEEAWTLSPTSSLVILATSQVAGMPFTLTASATGGGATITRASVTASSSNSDVGNAANWLRNGVAGLPQSGDDVIVANSTVPLLWNLTALAAVQFNSFNRFQNFTAQIGLPEYSANGYYQYRPINFQFSGSGTISVNLGVGQVGGGPTRERYDFQGTAVNVTTYASGSPADPYQVMVLGSNIKTLNVLNTSVGVAVLPGATASVTTAVVDGGGLIAYGSGVTANQVTLNQGAATLACTLATLNVYNGSQAVVSSTGGTISFVTAQNGSTVTWLSNTTLTSLSLTSGAIFDKSGDPRAMTLGSATIDGDTSRVLDPLNTISFSYSVTVKNAVQNGPFVFTNRTVLIS